MAGFKPPDLMREANVDDPKGYKALALERREGRLWLPNGTELVPNISVGPEPYHLDLFVEYERTFGRGNAKYATHDFEIYDQPNAIKKYGEGFGDEYKALSSEYSEVIARNSEQDTRTLVEKIKEYRRRHQGLYIDA